MMNIAQIHGVGKRTEKIICSLSTQTEEREQGICLNEASFGRSVLLW